VLIISIKKWSAKVAKNSSVAIHNGTFEISSNRAVNCGNQTGAMPSSFIFASHQIIEWTSL
jgi:hypothetical protein